MADIVRKVTCAHADTFHSIRWNKEKFSDRFDTEYEYCYCRICNTSTYTGQYRMVEVSVENKLNREQTPSAKEQYMNKDKLSVSRALKALHAKNDEGLSLKEFARRLARTGNELANDWFANKNGVCDAARSDKNKVRVTSEKVATKSARRSKKKGGSGVAAPAK